MSYVDPTEELTKAGGSSDPYAAYKKAGCEPGMFGKRPAATTEVNTASNSTVANSNDSLKDGQVVSDKVAGAGGANALIKAAGQSEAGGGKGGSGGGMSNGNGGQPSAVAEFSAAAKSGRGSVPLSLGDFGSPSVMEFPNKQSKLVADQDQRKRFTAASQIVNSYDRNSRGNDEVASVGSEMVGVMKGMSTEELQQGARLAANASLIPKQPKAEDVSSYRGDGFQQD